MNNTQYETTARFNRGQYQGYSSLRNTTGGGKPAERCVPSMGSIDDILFHTQPFVCYLAYFDLKKYTYMTKL